MMVSRFLSGLDERRRHEIEDDIAPLRGLSLAERGEILASVCRDAMAILRARPDFEEAMQRTEDRTEWLKLVAKFRR